MRKILTITFLALFLISFASAEILITQEPEENYNLGDIVEVPIKVTSLTQINNFLIINLICNGVETQVHKEYILLSPGEETKSNVKIPLIASFTARSSGTCSIKASIGEDYVTTDSFKISNTVTLSILEGTSQTNPGQSIIIEGEAKRANGENAEGFITASIIQNEVEQSTILDTINLGYFKLNISIPKDNPAGDYLIKLHAYEKDIEDQITNEGFSSHSYSINQIPTSIEINFENKELKSDSDLKFRAILHDQTGETIPAKLEVVIKNANNKVVEELTLDSDQSHTYHINYNEIPSEWTIQAKSENLETKNYFKILPNPKVNTIIQNQTLRVVNTGNIKYNDTVVVKIGEEPINLRVSLDLDGEEEYSLTAPDGEYQIEVLGETRTVALTGAVVGAKKVGTISKVIRYPFVWLFLVGILGFVTSLFLKKGYNKTFIGYVKKKKAPKKETKTSIFDSKNKAELSLSLKGVKQNVSLITLKIKNFKELIEKKENLKETLQRIVDLAENNKAATYDNSENTFFLFSPMLTKTFNNEKNAIQTAEKIKNILDEHNKAQKHKVEYGLSLNYGTIIAKKEANSLKFMSMGALITNGKRVASNSKGKILLGEKMKEKAASEIKTEKSGENYEVKEIKHKRSEDKTFINNFIKRLEEHK